MAFFRKHKQVSTIRALTVSLFLCLCLSQCVIGGDSGTACTISSDCIGKKQCVAGVCLSLGQARERGVIPRTEVSSTTEPAYTNDTSGKDGGPVADQPPALFLPSFFGLSSGGGVMRSANYQLKGRLGPRFTETMQSPGYRMKAGVLWGVHP